jgi:hypothetical protein
MRCVRAKFLTTASIPPTAAKSGPLPERQFVLCPEPQVSVYKDGGANINSADSWSCQAPKPQPL